MVNEFDNWDMKQAEWRGYTLRALEDMNTEIKGLKKQFNRMEEKIDKVNRRLTNTQVKLATLAGTVSILVTLLTTVILNGLMS